MPDGTTQTLAEDMFLLPHADVDVISKALKSLSKVASFAGENDLVESAAGLLKNP